MGHDNQLGLNFAVTHVINNFKAEQETLCQKIAEERNILQQNILEKERLFERELEELTKFNKQISPNLEVSTELKTERDDQPPQKIARRKEMSEDKPLTNAPAMESLKQAEVSEEIPCM